MLNYALLAAAIGAAQPEAAASTPAPVTTEAEPTPSAEVETAPTEAEANVTRYAPSFFAQSRPSTAYDMIQRVPGFTVTNGEDARGLSGTAGNVLVNGERPASKSDTIADVLQRIPAEQVVRIDLIRGGAPGIDMQGRPVVANVIATQSKRLSGSATIGADHVITTDRRSGSIDLVGAYKVTTGQTLRGQISYDNAYGPTGMGGGGGGGPGGPGGGGVSNQIISNRTGYTSSGPLGSGTTGRGTSKGLTGLAGYDFRALGGDGSLSLQMSKNKVEGFDTEIFVSGAAPRLARTNGDRKGGEFNANYNHPLFAGSTLVLTGLKSWRDNTSNTVSVRGSSISTTERAETSSETVGRVALNWRPIPSLSTVTSAEAAYNVLDGSSFNNLAGSPPVPPSVANVEEKRGEVGSVATWQARPNMVVEGGLRYEFSKLSAVGVDKSLQFMKPSLQASFRLSPARQLRFRLERTVGQLDFTDYLTTASIGTGIVTAGAPELTPTQDWALSAVFDQTFWGRGSFRLSVKGDLLNDVIDRTVTPSGFDTTGNIGEGKKANINANLNLPFDRLHIPGGRLVLDGQFRVISQVTDPFTGETRRISRDSPYTLMAQFSQDITRWRTTYGFSFSKMARSISYRRTGRDITQNDPQLSAYINYNPSSRTSWRLEARNITAGQFMSIRETHSGRRDITPLTGYETRISDTARTVRLTLRRSL